MLARQCVLFTVLWMTVSVFAQDLPYGVRDSIKRQTQNMGEIERELSQLSAQVQAGPSPQQQALLAQFQSMLSANPQLKAQFDAATPEQQAAFMAEMGIATGAGSGQMNAYGWLEQRLDSVQAAIDGAPADHPDVVALQARVNTARATISATESAEAADTKAALAANDLSDYPMFEQDLATAENMASQIASTLPLLQTIANERNSQPKADDMWLLTNKVSSDQLRQVQQTLDNADGYMNQIRIWDQQYIPLLNRSSTYKGRWYANLQYMPQLMAKLEADAAPAMQVLLLNAQHNQGVISRMIDYATERRMAAYFDGGIAQVRREIETIAALYPTKTIQGAPSAEQLSDIQEEVGAAIAAGLMALEDTLIAEQRFPPDNYDGGDADDLKKKAVALIERRFPGEDILDVAICCDWDTENYEEWVERVPGEWVLQKVHYRDIQIGVLMPSTGNRAIIRVVGVRQNFVSDKELVELLRDLPMLADNI